MRLAQVRNDLDFDTLLPPRAIMHIYIRVSHHRIAVYASNYNLFNRNSVQKCTGRGGRVVKAFDSKSNGVSPHRFESCPRRNVFCFFTARNEVGARLCFYMCL